MLPQENCTGCSACKEICPKQCIMMKPDEKGFLRPSIDAPKCIKCGACEMICPVLKPVQKYMLPRKVYAARIKEKDTLKLSSSGGIATMLAENVIRNGGAVYGAAFDENMIVRHIRVENMAELKRIQGSKYVQSDIQQIYSKIKEDLKDKRLVLVFATPCQIAGLRKIFGEKSNLIFCDLICHSAPSPKLFASHLQAIEEKGKKVVDYRFRDKTFGWSYNLNRIVYEDGTTELHSYWNQCYKRLFLLGLIARESCYNCAYADCSRVGDITLGDYWGIDKVTNVFSDDCGVNAVLFNTDKSVRLFEKLIQDETVCVETTLPDALQKHLIMPCEKTARIDEFWKCYEKTSYQNAAETFAGSYRYLTLRNGIKDFLREHQLLDRVKKRG